MSREDFDLSGCGGGLGVECRVHRESVDEGVKPLALPGGVQVGARRPPLIALIIAAEIAFWLMLPSGLATRYGLGRARLGMAMLMATPFVDLALLAATTIDLRRGGEAALPHALAAVYIGVSVGWGQRIVGWADARFAPVRRRAAT